MNKLDCDPTSPCILPVSYTHLGDDMGPVSLSPCDGGAGNPYSVWQKPDFDGNDILISDSDAGLPRGGAGASPAGAASVYLSVLHLSLIHI